MRPGEALSAVVDGRVSESQVLMFLTHAHSVTVPGSGTGATPGIRFAGCVISCEINSNCCLRFPLSRLQLATSTTWPDSWDDRSHVAQCTPTLSGDLSEAVLKSNHHVDDVFVYVCM